MAAIDLPFAASATKRAPNAGELANGYGCGPADIDLFNWLGWWLTGQLDQAATDAGLTPDDSALTLLSKLLRRRVSWRGLEMITATGSWDPASKGLTADDRILVFVWGSGGGGSSIMSSFGAGGGGGGLAIKSMNAPSSPVTVTVGAGGAGNNAGSAGGAGGTVSFGAFVSATGGTGATGASGTGGTGVGGDVNLVGSDGGDVINGVVAFADGGAAPFMGSNPMGSSLGPIGSGGWANSNAPLASAGRAGAILVIW